MAGWLNLLIFATVTKRFRYILAVILSLLIVYVGAGVSVAQYCCSGCETANCCCADKCGFCGKFDFEFHKSCRGEGCTATICKLDLVKQAFESSVPAPVSLLLALSFVSPNTDDTFTDFCPWLTTIVTVVPLSTLLPPAGVWEITFPASTLSLY